MKNLLKNITEKRDLVIQEIKTCEEIGQTTRFFIENDVEIYNDIISEIKKQSLNDRFFLEEAIFRNVKNWDNVEEYTTVLLHDWLYEMVENNPLTEQERKDYLASTGWDSDFLESAYFASERQLVHYLKSKELIEDYSIEDVSNGIQ
jgi:hypothetical protein